MVQIALVTHAITSPYQLFGTIVINTPISLNVFLVLHSNHLFAIFKHNSLQWFFEHFVAYDRLSTCFNSTLPSFFVLGWNEIAHQCVCSSHGWPNSLLTQWLTYCESVSRCLLLVSFLSSRHIYSLHDGGIYNSKTFPISNKAPHQYVTPSHQACTKVLLGTKVMCTIVINKSCGLNNFDDPCDISISWRRREFTCSSFAIVSGWNF